MRLRFTAYRWLLLMLLVLSSNVACQRQPAKPESPRTTDRTPTSTRSSVEADADDEYATIPLPILQVAGEASAEAAPKPPLKTNRLAKETSPYLLLHAHNPVDWYPWGPEAFEVAQREKKPIFLSIGYSSCYWCHVMERLVFSNPEIAKLMNENFINIKVDREERPDVDEIYMTALRVYLTLSGQGGGGGWPMSMFLTSDGLPIAGGTYFPPQDDGPKPGFPTVCSKLIEAWKTQPDEVRRNAQTVADVVRREMRPGIALEKIELDRELVLSASRSIVQSHDSEFGGIDFSFDRPNAPKFPSPSKLALLQYEAVSHQDGTAGRVLHHTLDAMAAGAIRDHLGGGFHRYSTDREWRLPHFEKMLYDNAQLLEIYVTAHRVTSKSAYREVIDETLSFLLAEMQDPEGGFYAALDAETGFVEGKFYAWSPEEIDRTLGPDAKLFRNAYGVSGEATFEPGHVLRLTKPLEQLAVEVRIPPRELGLRLYDMRRQLLAVRNDRPKPLKDNKIITSWNGLAIKSLAHVGLHTSRKEPFEAAERAALLILGKMRDKNGRLLRTYRAGQAKQLGYLDDYAFLIEGLLELHLATRDPKWLNASRHLMDDQIKFFWDETGHGFFYTSPEHEQLLTRFKDSFDSALPSGNSVSVRNLIRMASLTGENRYRQLAEQTLRVFAPQVKKFPRGSSQMAIGMGEFLDQPDFRSLSQRMKAPPEKKPEPPTDDKPDEAPTTPNPKPTVPTPPAKMPPTTDKTQTPAPMKEVKEVVAAQAFLSTAKLHAGSKTRLAVVLTIEPGWHINANPAGSKSALPTLITLKSKRGVTLANLKYPAGKDYQVEGVPETLKVYEGEITIIGDLEVPNALTDPTDEFELQVRYQACDSKRCLAPKTVRFTTKVPIATSDEPVEDVNDAIFNP